MQKHIDMTDSAQAVLHSLTGTNATPVQISNITGISAEKCQLILTQLVIAGIAEDVTGSGEKFRRCV